MVCMAKNTLAGKAGMHGLTEVAGERPGKSLLTVLRGRANFAIKDPLEMFIIDCLCGSSLLLTKRILHLTL